METIIQPQEQIQYAEAYISDMLELKTIFLQTQSSQTVNADFGVPFLLAKKKNKIIAFASLVINKSGEIIFRIYSKNGIEETEKRNFTSRAETYFKQNTTPNFRNPEQLKSSIRSMVSWLTS
jgi:hypothetical protein